MSTCACGNLSSSDGAMCHRCAALQELGLKAGATDAQVKAAHRLYVKAWHPDRFPGDEKSKSAAQEKLKAINSAYDLLTSSSSNRGQTYRPAAAAPPAPPRQRAQHTATPRPPSKTVRHWGWLVFLFPAILFAMYAAQILTSNWSKPTAPPQDPAPQSSSLAPRHPEHTSSPDPSDEKPGASLDPAQPVDSNPSAQDPDHSPVPGRTPDREPDHSRSANDDSGVAALAKACGEDNARACRIAGLAYGMGKGVPQDYQRAASLLSRACDGGDAVGCTDLGLLYANGLGVERNPGKTAQLLNKACGMGDQRGCDRLAQMR